MCQKKQNRQVHGMVRGIAPVHVLEGINVGNNWSVSSSLGSLLLHVHQHTSATCPHRCDRCFRGQTRGKPRRVSLRHGCPSFSWPVIRDDLLSRHRSHPPCGSAHSGRRICTRIRTDEIVLVYCITTGASTLLSSVVVLLQEHMVLSVHTPARPRVPDSTGRIGHIPEFSCVSCSHLCRSLLFQRPPCGYLLVSS